MAELREFRVKGTFKVLAALGYAMCLFGVWGSIHDPQWPKDWPMLAVFELLFLSVSTAMLLHGLARVTVDDDRIVLRLLGWQRAIEWANLASYELTGKLNGTGVLKHVTGARIRVEFSSFVDGLLLAGLIEHHSAKPKVGGMEERPELPIRARFATLRGSFIGVAALVCMLVMGVALSFLAKRPVDRELAMLLTVLLALPTLGIAVTVTSELRLFEDRIERTLLGRTRTTHFGDINRIVIGSSPRKPGASRLGSLQIFTARDKSTWGLPLSSGTEIVDALRGLLPGKVEDSPATDNERFEPEARARLVAEALSQVIQFRVATAKLTLFVALLYVPLLVGPIFAGAYSIRNDPEFRLLSVCGFVGSALFVAYVVWGV